MSHSYPQLEQMAEPTHEVLVDFAHNCSPDPAIRTGTVAATVLAFWQAGGRGMANHLPSTILVDAGESERDPIAAFLGGTLQHAGGPRLGEERIRLLFRRHPGESSEGHAERHC